MTHTIVVISAGIIFVIAIFLALSNKYEDGIIGNAALGGMALAAAAPLYESFVGSDYEFLPTTALLYASLALFLIRHAWRFICWSSRGNHDWRKDVNQA